MSLSFAPGDSFVPTNQLCSIPGQPNQENIISGDQVTSVMSLQNLDREDAFSESDVRLLSTLAASLSVALENARLFAETQRLLAETNERAAELAIINSVHVFEKIISI